MRASPVKQVMLQGMHKCFCPKHTRHASNMSGTERKDALHRQTSDLNSHAGPSRATSPFCTPAVISYDRPECMSSVFLYLL